MLTLKARNVNEALPLGLMFLNQAHWEIQPRDNVMWEHPEPVATVYARPWERVLFNPLRDANPFFHLFEALWILAGRRDVAWLSFFNSNIASFSDSGTQFHGAYGYRLRHEFGEDQIRHSIGLLREEPHTNRAVLQIWYSPLDLNTDSKDIPCNDLIFLKIRNGALHMRVCCRSNDIIWGAYGANAVQFSILQEYIAAALDVAVGTLTQISDSFHAYPSNPKFERLMEEYGGNMPCEYYDYYRTRDFVNIIPLVLNWDNFNRDLKTLFEQTGDKHTYGEIGNAFAEPFFCNVVTPMYNAYHRYKTEGLTEFSEPLLNEAEIDWHIAGREWLWRRVK